jgi:precorrin-8X/cobalt-precorrin-8 methylmutase
MRVIRPEDIMAESFRIIDTEVGEHSFNAVEWPIVRRMIHACGDVELARNVFFSLGSAAAGVQAFQDGTPIVTDVRMVAAGIQPALRAAMHVELHCFLDAAGAESEAQAQGMTRSACAMEQAITCFPEAAFVVGNAPTALAALTSAVCRGIARPRMIIAMPVGFVGVVESKNEAMTLAVPVIAVRGRRGGSAVAAAAVNALLVLAREGMPP